MPLAMALPFFPQEASAHARSVDHLFFFAAAIALFFSALIFLTILFFAIKYRRRSEDEVPPEIQGSLPLEIVWTGIPLILTLVLFFWGARVFVNGYIPPNNAMDVFVVGKQWMWKIQHPEGKSEINELHVPLGRPVRLIMTSEDVIHDFFIPAFRIKRDVVPGRYTSYWFTPNRIGRYHFFCAQYCGTQHSGMAGWVDVMEPSSFEQWLSDTPPRETMAQAGGRLFVRLNCNTCHKEGGKGPNLAGLYGSRIALKNGSTVVADDAYLRSSIVSPSSQIVRGHEALMPTFQGQISESQILEIIAYIKALGEEKGMEKK